MNSSDLKNDLFLRACKRESIPRTPIWIMRQAGRYLPEYRAVREKVDFLTLCKSPELAAEVTVQPIDLIGVDAAIIFSDILVIPEAMGMKLEMFEGKGPVFDNPIRSESDAQQLRDIDPGVELRYVMDAIAATKQALQSRVPIIGFCGSPWTLLTYMVEGQGSKNFANVKSLIYNNPELAHSLLGRLAAIAARYLEAKLQAGANAVQIFDTWGGILSQPLYAEFSLRYIAMIIEQLNRDSEPVIVFSKGVHHSLDALGTCGADVIGLDWTMDISSVRQHIGAKVALQGNMDPCVLLADEPAIEREASLTLNGFGVGNGHIFNLGHGILPNTPPEHARFLVDTVKERSQAYHKE